MLRTPPSRRPISTRRYSGRLTHPAAAEAGAGTTVPRRAARPPTARTFRIQTMLIVRPPSHVRGEEAGYPDGPDVGNARQDVRDLRPPDTPFAAPVRRG